MNNDLDLTFLTDKQVENLEILKKYGTSAAITDFAILLGGNVSSDEYTSKEKTLKNRSCEYTSEGNELKNRSCWWWTKSSNGDDTAGVVYESGYIFVGIISKRDGGARPATKYLSIKNFFKMKKW